MTTIGGLGGAHVADPEERGIPRRRALFNRAPIAAAPWTNEDPEAAYPHAM